MKKYRDAYLKTQTTYRSVKNVFDEILLETKELTVSEYTRAPQHKQLREKWIATSFTTLVEQMTNKKLYLRFPLAGEDPPDFVIASEKQNDGKHEIASVEIVQLDPHSFKNSKEKAEDLVLQRIASKTKASLEGVWPKDWQLCVYCNVSASLDLSYLRKALSTLKPPFGQIWILGASEKNITEVSTWEVWPGDQAFSMKAVTRT